MAEITYRRHRFPPTIIQHAVWLYRRFTLSYRDVGTTRSSEHSIKEPATVTTFRAMKGYGFITPD